MNIEQRAVELVANLAPWLAPLPTAWLVAERTMTHLHWPLWIAIVAGITLELLGVGILATWLMLYGYNRDKRQSDPPAPEWMGMLLVAVYFLVAEALTFALDVWPVAAVVAPALFPPLSIAAFVVLALRADHRRRLDVIEQEKAERKRQRTERVTKPEQTEQVQPDTLPFVCVSCGAKYATQRALSGHMNAHRTNGNGNGRKETEYERQLMAH